MKVLPHFNFQIALLSIHNSFFAPEWFEKRYNINQERLKTFRQACEKFPKEVDHEELVTNSFVFLNKIKVMGCSINKVGSTSLAHTFKVLREAIDGQDPDEGRIRIKVNAYQLEEQRAHYRKFVFVRDPMERLASAYNDKMVVNPSGWLVRFRENVKEIAIEIKGRKNSPGNQVSFDDFLTAVVIPGEDTATDYGRHLAPYYKICAPCTVGFDYIGLLDPTGEESGVSSMLFQSFAL